MVPVFRLFVLLILIAGSVSMAPARGQMAGMSQAEICSDAGSVTVRLDAQGNPVGPHLPCPDCIACVAFGPLPDIGTIVPAGVAFALRFARPDPIVSAGIRLIHPAARDPPRLA